MTPPKDVSWRVLVTRDIEGNIMEHDGEQMMATWHGEM